jgi:surface protein
MNFTRKKIGAALLSLFIMGGTVSVSGTSGIFKPAVASAAENDTITYDETTHVLTLRGGFDRSSIVQYYNKYYYSGGGVKTIVAEKGAVMRENAYALFSGFKEVETIDLSNVDGSRVKDAAQMFELCFKLKEVKLCEFTNPELKDVNNMFYACNSLKTVDLSKIKTSSVEDCGGMFASCISLKNINFTGFDTSNVTSFREMFYHCRAFENIDLSQLDTSSATKFYGMFQGCSSLKTLDLSGFDPSKVTDARFMFEGCSALTDINLSGWDTKSLTLVEEMFSNCSALRSLDLSSFDTSHIGSFDKMFLNCSNLESIDLSSFDTSNTTGFFDMFSGCSKIKKLDLSNFDSSSLYSAARMFNGCTNLEEVDLSGLGKPKISEDKPWFTGRTNTTDMFNGCANLKYLDIGNFDTSAITDATNMFNGCTHLKYIDLTKNSFDSLKNFDDMFTGCDDLAPYSCTVNGVSVYLDGSIGMNFYVTVGSAAVKAVFSGPMGETVIDDLAPYKLEDGTYKFGCPVNALHMGDMFDLNFYDKDGKQFIAFKSNNTPFSYATASYSIRSYILNFRKHGFVNPHGVDNVLYALERYGSAVENHFLGTTNEVSLGEVVKKDNVADFKPTFGTDISISLVLGSETSLRIYTDKENVTINGVTANEETSQYGRYYEIKNIPAHKLMDNYTVVADGTKFTVNPMNYVYRVLDREDAPPTLSVVVKALYLYARNARNYVIYFN